MIRVMSAEDLEQAAELERICFSEPWSYRILEAGIYSPYDRYLVYEQEMQVMGYGNLRVLAGEGEIQRIAVLPQFRRLGVARKLMDAMVSAARKEGVSTLCLEVREGNVAARNLYESYGFVSEAVRKDYYSNPTEDAVLMWRRDV